MKIKINKLVGRLICGFGTFRMAFLFVPCVWLLNMTVIYFYNSLSKWYLVLVWSIWKCLPIFLFIHACNKHLFSVYFPPGIAFIQTGKEKNGLYVQLKKTLWVILQSYLEPIYYLIVMLTIKPQQHYHSSQNPKCLESHFQALSETPELFCCLILPRVWC